MESTSSAQLDLLSVLPTQADPSFAGARRVPLDPTSWVEHVPGWLTGSDALLAELLASAAWEQRTRRMFDKHVQEPRLTAEYESLGEAPHPVLRDVADVLGRRYGTDYQRLWLNLYRDNRDSTGWHGDLIGRREAVSAVPVLSLGATRRFLIKPTSGGTSIGFTVAAGDLLVMGGRSQRDWRHCVPKQQTPAGPRVSVNFAPANPEDRTGGSR